MFNAACKQLDDATVMAIKPKQQAQAASPCTLAERTLQGYTVFCFPIKVEHGHRQTV